jgi:predicted TIM-barrel fold metal-dependent hydrolase
MPIDRRTVLATGAAAASLAATDALAQAPGATSLTQQAPVRTEAQAMKERVVTLEEHFWARSALPEPLLKRAQVYMGQKLQDDLADLDAGRIRHKDENNITVQVISATVPGAESIEGQEGIKFAQTTNDTLAAAVKRHPSRFAGFAHLPMLQPEAAADELERAVTRLGFRGALINGTTQGKFLDDPRFSPILARAAKLDVPIYIHPNWPVKAVAEAYYGDLPGATGSMLSAAMFGWHAELGVHVLRLAISGTLERHPGLQIIIGHMGEMLPFMMDRIDHAHRDLAGFPGPSPTKIIRERVHITTSGVFSTPALLAALTSFGADRIMYSVDYPYSMAFHGKPWLETLPVSPEDRAKIVHGNADRLLKLNPTA